MNVKNIAVFASGAGTNTRQIIKYFNQHQSIKVALIVCNNPAAGVLKIAEENKIDSVIISRSEMLSDEFVSLLKKRSIDLIILAGFLWKVPPGVIRSFPNKIINIHPALLPKYGGKGMYGEAVHRAVIAAGEKQSGITIHYVDEHYDNGKIISQETVPIDEGETSESLAKKIHDLEYKFFAPRIEELLRDQ